MHKTRLKLMKGAPILALIPALLMGALAFPAQAAQAETSVTVHMATAASEAKTARLITGTFPGVRNEDPGRDAWVSARIREMTQEEKAAQLFFVAPEALTGVGQQTEAGEATRSAYASHPVGGIILMGPNIQDPEQTAALTAGLQRCAVRETGIPLFIGVDEEGGLVARVSGNPAFGLPRIPNAYEIGASGSGREALALSYGRAIGTYLSGYGFNVDFAPVADVWSNPANTVIARRAYSGDPREAAQLSAAAAQGLMEGGVLACAKHFPGHGDTATDSHVGYAASGKTLEELRATELIPFAEHVKRGIPFVMAGHISLPKALGSDLPATLDPGAIDGLLRTELGYDGIVITDAMNMGAVAGRYSSGDAALAAISAGCDMILMPADFESAYDAVLSAIRDGRISEDRLDRSLTRILRVKYDLRAR